MQLVQKIMAAQSALPALFFGADALSETGLENWMRLKIAHLDAPTALAQLLQNETANAAFYHFTTDHHLALIKLPENMVHPHPGGGNRPAESCERPKN